MRSGLRITDSFHIGLPIAILSAIRDSEPDLRLLRERLNPGLRYSQCLNSMSSSQPPFPPTPHALRMYKRSPLR